MSLRHRYDDDVSDVRAHGGYDSRDDAVGRPDGWDRGRRDELAGEELVDTRSTRWDVGSVLAIAAGVALTVLGAVALVRTGIDETWYHPVDEVAGISHTPLLGAVEIGVGVLLMLAGLAGARVLVAFVALAAGAAAAVVAIEPDVADRELAIERGWASALAIGGLALALIVVLSREHRRDRRVERRSVRTA
jgi:peptidoglycan/LPS O-acetylase OafA/YrhL